MSIYENIWIVISLLIIIIIFLMDLKSLISNIGDNIILFMFFSIIES